MASPGRAGAAAVLLGALLTGCGGSHAPTRADVVARGDAICETAQRDVRSLPAASGSIRSLAAYLVRATEIVDREVAQLGALPRPVADRPDLDHYLAAMQAAARTYHDMSAAAGRGERTALQRAFAQLKANRAAAYAERYGLTGCAGGATVGSS